MMMTMIMMMIINDDYQYHYQYHDDNDNGIMTKKDGEKTWIMIDMILMVLLVGSTNT